MGDAERAYEGELHRLARERGLEEQVRFLGHVDDMTSLYRDVDVVVHTSVAAEPFGLVVAEAMAAGRPVVASDLGGPTEIVEHGRTGLLFRPGDPDALAKAIVRVLSEPGFARALARDGYARVRDGFDVCRTAREVMGVYDELLS